MHGTARLLPKSSAASGPQSSSWSERILIPGICLTHGLRYTVTLTWWLLARARRRCAEPMKQIRHPHEGTQQSDGNRHCREAEHEVWNRGARRCIKGRPMPASGRQLAARCRSALNRHLDLSRHDSRYSGSHVQHCLRCIDAERCLTHRHLVADHRRLPSHPPARSPAVRR